MRRGRGRGNNQSMGRNSEAPGPLMTEHIRNLDMELELLKRKREMIEQQQQLLNRQMDYDNQRQYIPSLFDSKCRDEPTSSRNFSHMYDDYSSSDYIPLNSGGRKRPSESTWRDTPQPKRFSGSSSKRGAGKRPFGSRLGSAPKPASAPNAPPRYYETKSNSVKSKPPPSQKPKGVPSQSFKAKPSAPPNKLATYPVPERKALVAQAVKATKGSMVLRPNETPSVQLNGRLELALGHLLKDMKIRYGSVLPYAMNFFSQAIKPMKKLIRERVREVMMGKEVGTLPEIMLHYRSRYPIESDLDILNEGLAHQTPADVNQYMKSLRTENPEKYYKEGISLMIEQKLHQMFTKLSELYAKDAPQGETTVELTPISKPIEKKNDSDFSEDVTIEPEENQNKDKDVEQGKEDVPIEEASGNEMGTAEKEQEDAAEKEQEDTAEKEKVDIAENKDEDTVETEKIIEKDQASEKEKEEVRAKEKAVAVPKNKEGAIPMEVEENDKAQVDGELAKEKVILERLIEQKLPAILKKYITFITNLLNIDELVDSIRKVPKSEFKKKPTTDPLEPRSPVKFFVKIYGRKGFPKKHLMKEFLKPFKPRSVKKHKAVSNLLFVGFDNKESFDKILESNGTVVGKCALQITVSENRKDKPKDIEDEQGNDEVQIVEENINQDDVKLIKDLDNQIDDLLSSIREAEESTIPIEDNDENSQVDKDKTQIDKDVENAIKSDPDNNATDNTANKDVQENGKNEQELKEEPTPDVKDASIEVEPKPSIKNLEVINEESATEENAEGKKTAVEAVKNDAAKGTPTRASTRLTTSTPSTIRTRRASRLAQNN